MRLLDGILSILQLIPQLQYLQGLPARAHILPYCINFLYTSLVGCVTLMLLMGCLHKHTVQGQAVCGTVGFAGVQQGSMVTRKMAAAAWKAHLCWVLRQAWLLQQRLLLLLLWPRLTCLHSHTMHLIAVILCSQCMKPPQRHVG